MNVDEFLDMFDLVEPNTVEDFSKALYVISGQYGSLMVAMNQMYNLCNYYPTQFKQFAAKMNISTKDECDKLFDKIHRSSRKLAVSAKKSSARDAGFEIMWNYLLGQVNMTESMKLSQIFESILLEVANFKGEMLLLKNTDKAPNMGSRYGQDVEPAGFYVIEYHEQHQKHLLSLPNYKLFKVNIKNPLVISVDDDSIIEWKRNLSEKYKATGKKLSSKLKSDGYDVIVTYDPKYNETGEIIVLDTNALEEL